MVGHRPRASPTWPPRRPASGRARRRSSTPVPGWPRPPPTPASSAACSSRRPMTTPTPRRPRSSGRSPPAVQRRRRRSEIDEIEPTRDAIRYEAQATTLLGLVLALLATAFVGQAIARQSRREWAEGPMLRAVGVTTGQAMASAALRSLGISVPAAVRRRRHGHRPLPAGPGGGRATSRRSTPGSSVDAAVLALGALAVLVVGDAGRVRAPAARAGPAHGRPGATAPTTSSIVGPPAGRHRWAPPDPHRAGRGVEVVTALDQRRAPRSSPSSRPDRSSRASTTCSRTPGAVRRTVGRLGRRAVRGRGCRRGAARGRGAPRRHRPGRVHPGPGPADRGRVRHGSTPSSRSRASPRRHRRCPSTRAGRRPPRARSPSAR